MIFMTRAGCEMKNKELFQANSGGYLYTVLHVESGHYCMTASGEKASLRYPSSLDHTVHDMVHFRDIPLFF